MALTLSTITPIPTTPKPDATPSLWNYRYDQITLIFNELNAGKQDSSAMSGFAPLESLAYRPGHTYAANDWAWLDKPGGLIIQWGSILVTGGSFSTVTLPTAFASIIFSASGVWATDSYTSSANGSVLVGNFSVTEFDIGVAGSSGHYQINWIAIGK